MFGPALQVPGSATTSHRAILPFYVYAALSFCIAAVMLLTDSRAFLQKEHFHPHLLGITHTMALGWATMIILGASHQLLPVLAESRLYSEKLALLTFGLSACGIPLLVYGLHQFELNAFAKTGAWLINLAIVVYLINIARTIGKQNMHPSLAFVFTATLWLLFTTGLGLAILYNFTETLLPKDSLHYLSLHAHAGIGGWFLLLVCGVASRLIPMFLISKYSNPPLLWIVFGLINLAMLLYLLIFLKSGPSHMGMLPTLLILLAVVLFIVYCIRAYRQRLRKKVDAQVQLSLLSILMILVPLLALLAGLVTLMMQREPFPELVLAYGFMIFFGWLSAIILGMTFKTLPFIVWNRAYRSGVSAGHIPFPKDLFNNRIFRIMAISYLIGIVGFVIGILASNGSLLKSAALLLLIAACLYNFNVFKIIRYKPLSK